MGIGQEICMHRKSRSKAGQTVQAILSLFLLLVATMHAQETSSSSKGAADLATQAEQALRAQDFPAATKAYRAMLEADPKNSEAWTGLGVLLYGSGRAAEAQDALTRALSLNPAAPRAELFLAFSRADLQECDKALPVLERAFAAEPAGKLQRLTGLTLLGCTAGVSQEALAVRTAAQLKQTYPGDADVLYQSAELYTRLWNESANQLMTAHPDSFRVHQLAGEVNEAQGNTGQAIRQYRSALAENAKLPQMHFRIGQLLLKQGEPDADARAMEEFRDELAINPRSGPAALAMGEIERHEGHLEEAAKDYRLAAQIEPGLTEAHVGLAQTLLAQHQVPAAQAELQAALARDPNSAQAHYTMMLTYRAQGKLPEAAVELQAFQRLQQGSAEQFRDKLNALLSGSASSSPDPAAHGASASPAASPEPNR